MMNETLVETGGAREGRISQRARGQKGERRAVSREVKEGGGGRRCKKGEKGK